MGPMAMTPAYTLAHVFLPNLIKLKSPAVVMHSIERKEKVFFDPLWQQAYLSHNPQLGSQTREPYRIGVLSLPEPKEIGEAHMAAIVLHKQDASFFRYFTLEHDYVLAKRANRTVVCERHNQTHIKHGDGPELTGSFEADWARFADVFMTKLGPRQIAR